MCGSVPALRAFLPPSPCPAERIARPAGSPAPFAAPCYVALRLPCGPFCPLASPCSVKRLARPAGFSTPFSPCSVPALRAFLLRVPSLLPVAWLYACPAGLSAPFAVLVVRLCPPCGPSCSLLCTCFSVSRGSAPALRAFLPPSLRPVERLCARPAGLSFCAPCCAALRLPCGPFCPLGRALLSGSPALRAFLPSHICIS